jgi:N-acetyl-anhydromuramyl-L-alanine amidase AmpD
MAVKNLPKYKDMRGKLTSKGSYSTVAISKKDWIVIHHSLTLEGSAEAYARYHVTSLGWAGIGYHYVIEKDGTIKQCHDNNIKSYHVGNSNARSIGICLTGDFRKGNQKPTDAQKESLYLLVKELKKEVPSVSKVLGHQECPGYSWKNCPGDNWDYRTVVAGTDVPTSTSKTATTVSPLPNEYTIQEGDTFYSIARKTAGVTYEEIMKLNPKVDPKKLKVGQVIKLKAKETVTLPSGVLKEGDKGNDVKAVQNALNTLKYNCGTADGIFGNKTEEALKAYQKQAGLSVDGVYGPKSKTALEKELNK